MRRKIGLFLMVSAVFYVMAVVIGGFMKENYSHIYNAISELSESGTGKIFIVELLFSLYNILLVIYSFWTLIAYRKNLNKKQTTILISLFLCGLSGFLMGIFPQESRDAELTFLGIMHFVGAGVAAVTTMLCAVLSFINYVKNENLKSYAIYSIITFVIIFCSGITNVILISNNIGNFFGLVERMTIGSFILWLFVTGYVHYKGKLLDI